MGGKKNIDSEAWEPRYGNDSRPWLLGFSETERMATTSTTKDTFTGDWPPNPSAEGMRRQLLRKALWDQMKREVVEEMSQQEEMPATATEYNETFVREGFTPGPIKTDPELHRQYPLYGDTGLSLWQEKFPQLPGSTKAPHVQHRFRRYSAFTKPIDKAFDDNLELK